MHRLIPIQICHLCLKQRSYNQFRSYLVLNFKCSGYIKRIEAIRVIMNELSIARNSAKNHIKYCIESNWLGEHDGIIYIRSIDYIRVKEKATQRGAVWLHYKFLKSFKAFCFAALITQITKDMRWLRKDNNSGMSNQTPKSTFYPIAGNYITQRYGISQPVCSRLASLAKHYGFIDTKESLIPYSPDGQLHKASELRLIKSNIGLKESSRLIVKKGIIYIQMPTKMRSILQYKRRKRA